MELIPPPRPTIRFTDLERRTLRRIGFRSRSRRVMLRRPEMGRVLYSKRGPFIPQGQALVLAENGLEGLFFFADSGSVERRRYMDLETIFPFPPGDWSNPPRSRAGRNTTEELLYPSLEGLQFETFDARVMSLDLIHHHTDLVMAVLKDRLDERWDEVFQGKGGKELPPSYWGRYHKLIYIEPGREDED